ncbi:hypothetical protein M752DRAFT_279875 [Aspergillus phoenicis ATCC 13157]|uniref:Uncharacterized protein n=1 Tax=Aspergillus phoenicis ATCC 13157 TaxID=1353007 RepID=A0A370P5I0_ASPPH|nr:hypothetical protein M752DRAFT_279875 [Aspergillus phoenicis ATCC 13157]
MGNKCPRTFDISSVGWNQGPCTIGRSGSLMIFQNRNPASLNCSWSLIIEGDSKHTTGDAVSTTWQLPVRGSFDCLCTDRQKSDEYVVARPYQSNHLDMWTNFVIFKHPERAIASSIASSSVLRWDEWPRGDSDSAQNTWRGRWVVWSCRRSVG